MQDQNFPFVRKIGKIWILHFQLACGLVVYIGLVLALVGFFLPRSWYVSYIGFGLAISYPVWAYLEGLLFENHIKCPKCGFNLTHGKTTGRPLHPSVAMNRLSEYIKCPKCSYGS